MEEKLGGNALKLHFLLAATLLFMVMCFTSSAFADDQPSGTGTVEDPYQIGTLDELYWFVDYVNASTLTDDEKLNAHNAVLTADIVVNSGVMSEETNPSRVVHWTSIKNYNAVFDGQGHTISGIYFDDVYTDTFNGGGFIANTKTQSAKIENLGIINSYFTSYDKYLGAICGYSLGTVESCHNSSTVYGTQSEGTTNLTAEYVSGICGYSQNSSIINCYNTGKITNIFGSTAGICGYSQYTNIIYCYNAGNIYASVRAGGICASFRYGTIECCYNTADIDATRDSGYEISARAGGIVGAGGNVTYIINCYNLGGYSSTVIAVNPSRPAYAYAYAYAGGICGSINANGRIENCFNYSKHGGKAYAEASKIQEAYVGGIVAYIEFDNNDIVNNCYSYNIDGSGINGTVTTAEEFLSGEITYLLNESVSGATTWYQNIDLGEADALPTLDNSHYRVYYDASTDIYSNSTDVMSGICGGGRYGVNILYLLNTATQTLEITGSGEMADYTEDTAAPWAEYSTYIKYIVVSESAQLDAHAFDGCDSIEVVYCYEGSPADEYFSGDSSITRKYVVDENTLKIADLDTEARTFTVTVNTDEFGGTGAKYLDEVKVIVNNNDEGMGVTNYSDDETDSKYINFDVSCTEGTEDIVEIRGEVIAKNSPEDEGLLYYVTDIYDLSTGA